VQCKCSNDLFSSKSGWEWLLLCLDPSQLAIKGYVLSLIGCVQKRWLVGRKIPHSSKECSMPSYFKMLFISKFMVKTLWSTSQRRLRTIDELSSSMVGCPSWFINSTWRSWSSRFECRKCASLTQRETPSGGKNVGNEATSSASSPKSGRHEKK